MFHMAASVAKTAFTNLTADCTWTCEGVTKTASAWWWLRSASCCDPNTQPFTW